jgi:hypothetical protein
MVKYATALRLVALLMLSVAPQIQWPEFFGSRMDQATWLAPLAPCWSWNRHTRPSGTAAACEAGRRAGVAEPSAASLNADHDAEQVLADIRTQLTVVLPR